MLFKSNKPKEKKEIQYDEDGREIIPNSFYFGIIIFVFIFCCGLLAFAKYQHDVAYKEYLAEMQHRQELENRYLEENGLTTSINNSNEVIVNPVTTRPKENTTPIVTTSKPKIDENTNSLVTTVKKPLVTTPKGTTISAPKQVVDITPNGDSANGESEKIDQPNINDGIVIDNSVNGNGLTAEEQAAIDKQFEEILNSPLFANGTSLGSGVFDDSYCDECSVH